MTTYTATVTNEDGEKSIIEMEYPTKQDFAHDLRANGYKVSNKNIHTVEQLKKILDSTNND